MSRALAIAELVLLIAAAAPARAGKRDTTPRPGPPARVGDIRRDPQRHVARLRQRGYSATVARQLVAQRPDIVSKIWNGRFNPARRTELDLNGRAISLNAEAMLSGHKPTRVYRGVSVRSPDELAFVLSVDPVLQPISLAYPRTTFVTEAADYAEERYTPAEDTVRQLARRGVSVHGFLIEYELPPQLVYRGAEGAGARREYVIDNDRAFKRRASFARDIVPLLERSGWSPERIAHSRDSGVFALSAVYDMAPFVRSIVHTNTGRRFTVASFREAVRKAPELFVGQP